VINVVSGTISLAEWLKGKMKAIEPTDPEYEAQKGRIAVWLDTQDIEWLSRHCCCPSDAMADVTERCARIRFRAGAALHKAQIKE
jgi:hypothetical protein